MWSFFTETPLRKHDIGLRGSPVVKNPLANAGDKDPWSGTVPQATGQRSLRAATSEACTCRGAWSPRSGTTAATARRSLRIAAREQPLLNAAKEKPTQPRRRAQPIHTRVKQRKTQKTPHSWKLTHKDNKNRTEKTGWKISPVSKKWRAEKADAEVTAQGVPRAPTREARGPERTEELRVGELQPLPSQRPGMSLPLLSQETEIYSLEILNLRPSGFEKVSERSQMSKVLKTVEFTSKWWLDSQHCFPFPQLLTKTSSLEDSSPQKSKKIPEKKPPQTNTWWWWVSLKESSAFCLINQQKRPPTNEPMYTGFPSNFLVPLELNG